MDTYTLSMKIGGDFVFIINDKSSIVLPNMDTKNILHYAVKRYIGVAVRFISRINN